MLRMTMMMTTEEKSVSELPNYFWLCEQLLADQTLPLIGQGGHHHQNCDDSSGQDNHHHDDCDDSSDPDNHQDEFNE